MSNSLKSNWDVIVVGGGPAGFFAAIRCAALNPKLNILILERASQTLGKVLISGGGRCNVTHACFEPEKLVTFYPRGGNELRGAFSRFQPRHTVEWFQSRGVKLKTESDGRMFPSTDDSNTIAECLRESARMAGVKVQIGASLLGVEKSLGGGFRLEVQHARVEPSRNEAKSFIIQTKKLLIATGSDRKTLDIVKSLGHELFIPGMGLCIDNAAMIALAGYLHFRRGDRSDLGLNPRASMAL